MSEKKKLLLNEKTNRKWAKLAGFKPVLTENFFSGVSLGEEEDPVDDIAGDEVEEMPEAPVDAPEDMGGEDFDVDLDSDAVEALIQLGQQLQQLQGGDMMDQPPGEDLQEPPMSGDEGDMPLEESGAGHPPSASGQGPKTKHMNPAPKAKLEEECTDEEYKKMEEQVAESLARNIAKSMLQEQKRKEVLSKIDTDKLSKRISERLASELSK